MLAPIVNGKGLNWSEWFLAAGFGVSTLANLSSKQFQALRSAWEQGADPNTWMAYKPARLPACSCGVDRECEKHPYVRSFEEV